MINEQATKIALIGAGCSVVSERIAKEAKTWNLVMVSIETGADPDRNVTVFR